jgi:hypothetical protein
MIGHRRAPRSGTCSGAHARKAEDLFAGWWQLISSLGVVPRVLVWDGEGAIGRWRGGRTGLTGQCQAFRGTLAAKVVVCKPADPEAKGLVERVHDCLERSFLPGRSFDGPADFNVQPGAWAAVVNTRGRRALGCMPADRIAAGKAGDAGAAAGRAGGRVAVLVAAGPRPLRPAGL